MKKTAKEKMYQFFTNGRGFFLRKFLGTLLCAMLVLSSMSTCFASIQDRQAAVGGVGPGCTLEYVRQVYGEPDSQQTKYDDGMHITKYYYGDTFVICAMRNRVINVTCKANNLKTPDGIKVGMSSGMLPRTYGKASGTYQRNDLKYFVYSNGDKTLEFGVRNQKIVTIQCGAN